MNRIQSRSPYFVKHTESNLTSAVVEVWVYTGTQTTSRPATATFNLEIEAYNETIITDISQFVEDEIDVLFEGTYSSLMVWVDYQVTPFVSEVEQASETLVALEGFLGFRNHREGAQNSTASNDTNVLLMSNRTVYRPEGTTVTVPLIKDSSYSVTFHDAMNSNVYSEDISSSVVSTSRIGYVNDSGTAGLDSYKDRVLADGGTFEENECLCSSLVFDSTDISKIYINGELIKINVLEKSKFPQYKLTFVNKFGAFQDLWFTGRSQEKLSTESGSSYRRNILVDDSYNISSHNRIQQVKNGTESMTLSTGFLNEDHNEVFRQLQLSKYVWIEIEGETLPVTVKDSGMTYKTVVNDKLIAFKLEIEFAYNTINDIR